MCGISHLNGRTTLSNSKSSRIHSTWQLTNVTTRCTHFSSADLERSSVDCGKIHAIYGVHLHPPNHDAVNSKHTFKHGISPATLRRARPSSLSKIAIDAGYQTTYISTGTPGRCRNDRNDRGTSYHVVPSVSLRALLDF